MPPIIVWLLLPAVAFSFGLFSARRVQNVFGIITWRESINEFQGSLHPSKISYLSHHAAEFKPVRDNPIYTYDEIDHYQLTFSFLVHQRALNPVFVNDVIHFPNPNIHAPSVEVSWSGLYTYMFALRVNFATALQLQKLWDTDTFNHYNTLSIANEIITVNMAIDRIRWFESPSFIVSDILYDNIANQVCINFIVYFT